MEAEEGAKGLAAKIRARELDVPNRIKAVNYLAQLDGARFPEAREMLLKMLDPAVEPWEEVRYAAAYGLKQMLSCKAGAAQTSAKKSSSGRVVGGSTGRTNSQCSDNSCGDQGRGSLWDRLCGRSTGKTSSTAAGNNMCNCRSCCDAETLQILAKTAYELKEDGCCYEPSRRVRQMAVEAIQVCGIPCSYAPYHATPEVAPAPTEEMGGVPYEENLDNTPEKKENLDVSATGAAFNTTVEATPIASIIDVCIVSLRDGIEATTDRQFQSEYRGRIYYFSSAEAKQKFDESPVTYAVAFGGCDPVAFVATRQVTEGEFLIWHDGHFYMFATQDNYSTFLETPEAYALPAAEEDLVVAG
jgi:YHS domain-containing protein